MPDLSIRGIPEWINDICNCEFYEEIPDTEQNYKIGQFFNGHIKYPFSVLPKVLELEEFDSEDELNSVFKIADYDSSSENQRMRPIKQLNLKSTDRLYVVPGKLRTVILLRIIENVWMEDETIKMALCLPTSSFKLYQARRLILNMQLFNYPQYFYIKPSDKGAREESAARFDLLQYVPLDQLKPVQNERSNSNFRLSSYMLKLMFNHLSRFVFDKPNDKALDEEIVAFRDIMLQEESIKKLLEEEQ